MEKKPYLVRIDETYTRTIVVYAENPCEAEERAYDLCNDAKVCLGYTDFSIREAEAVQIANESDIELYETFNK